MNTMEVLSKHRLVKNRLEANMKFLGKMIDLLKVHEVDMEGEDYHAQIDEIVTTYDELNQQKVLTIKTNILPLQQEETIKLKKEIKDFEDKVKNFRKEFLEDAPFNYNPEMPSEDYDKCYDQIDSFWLRLQDIIKEAKIFNDKENLFELELTKYKALKDCEEDC